MKTDYVRNPGFIVNPGFFTFKFDNVKKGRRRMIKNIKTKKLIRNNHVIISGKVCGKLLFSHTAFGENFYSVTILVKRLRGYEDRVPVIASDRFLEALKGCRGQFVRIHGELHTYNRSGGERRHLDLFVFAHEVELLGSEFCLSENRIHLNGHVCKKPVYRITPLGREIADLLVAVNRPYGKSDYIPCVCWGKNAKYAAGFGLGMNVDMCGRIQSREYTKKFDDGRKESRMAYEVSIGRIDQEVSLNDKMCRGTLLK